MSLGDRLSRNRAKWSVRACACNRRAAKTTLRPPVALETSTTLSGYHASTCITMLDDASLGGKDATYLYTSPTSTGSILCHFPFRFVVHRDASQNTFASLFRLSCSFLAAIQFVSLLVQ
jgi:hypothetical protein